MHTSTSRRRAFSPVISALILSAVVLAVGGAIWAFSQGATTVIAGDYVDGIANLMEVISERFIIEHVSYDDINDILHVWVYNYGDVNIEVKVNVEIVTEPESSDEWIEVISKDLKHVQLMDFSATSGNELNIKVYSRRDRHVYYRFLTP